MPLNFTSYNKLARKDQWGLSLIDLMIVVAIVFITAGLGIPSLQALLSESRAQSYLRSLSRDIMYVRNYSITQGQAVTLCPLDGSECSNDWSKNISIFIDNDLNRVRASDEKLLKLIKDPSVGDFFGYPRIGITFRSDGSINGFQSGTFRYCPDKKDSEFSKALVINQAGRSRFHHHKVKCK